MKHIIELCFVFHVRFIRPIIIESCYLVIFKYINHLILFEHVLHLTLSECAELIDFASENIIRTYKDKNNSPHDHSGHSLKLTEKPFLNLYIFINYKLRSYIIFHKK